MDAKNRHDEIILHSTHSVVNLLTCSSLYALVCHRARRDHIGTEVHNTFELYVLDVFRNLPRAYRS
jgi:hypothetical protein